MNTPEHMIFAKPDVWCSNASPGGGTYGVSSSNDFARAIRAALVGSGCCDAAVLTARATITGTSESLIMTISCDGIHQEATFKGYTSCPSIGRAKNSARYWADARYGAPSQFTLDQRFGTRCIVRVEEHDNAFNPGHAHTGVPAALPPHPCRNLVPTFPQRSPPLL